MLVIKSTRPRFRNNHDKVAFVVHATFVVSGYKLVAIGRHALATLSLPLLLECLAIGDKLLVDAIAVGGTYPTAHLEINSKRNREPEPVHYARRPFPLGPQFHQPSG
ncbi:probable proteasome inhibitor [Brassica napus]|uniref:probable proteasome inhibitor n=1 Tax=Brassica napus TaxID=3708 RepID=UPI002078CF04|nr:probable proteasome inhibitor [Brassica napus]